MSRHWTSGPNAARDIIEYALEQSSTPRGAHRAADSAGLSPRHVTLTALVAGAVTMSSPALASADSPADHAQRGAAPQSADVSQQIAATGQNSPKTSSAQSDGILKNGSQGHKVQELQRVLNAWYPFLKPLKQDGDYGQKTADRVRYLQKRADLTVDGIAGPSTLGTLNMRSGKSGGSQQPANTGGQAPAQSSNQQTAASAASPDQENAAPTENSDQGSNSAAENSSQENTPAAGNSKQESTPPAGNAPQQRASSATGSSSGAGSTNSAPAQKSTGAGNVVSPTSGTVTSPYGARGGGHAGVDIANDLGTPIYATTSGKVIDAGPASGFGKWVRIQHDDGKVSVYGHINEALVSSGQHVNAGQQIATMGNRGQSTGPHLHFEIWQNGGQEINPVAWLSQHGVSL